MLELKCASYQHSPATDWSLRLSFELFSCEEPWEQCCSSYLQSSGLKCELWWLVCCDTDGWWSVKTDDGQERDSQWCPVSPAAHTLLTDWLAGCTWQTDPAWPGQPTHRPATSPLSPRSSLQYRHHSVRTGIINQHIFRMLWYCTRPT